MIAALTRLARRSDGRTVSLPALDHDRVGEGQDQDDSATFLLDPIRW
jgi:hypothetical protein